MLNSGVSQYSPGVVSLAYAIVNGRLINKVTMANSGERDVAELACPRLEPADDVVGSAPDPRAASTTKKTAPNTSSACTGTPRRQPIHRVNSVNPSAAEAASSNRPGPDTTAKNTQGAMPASGDLT